MKKKALLFTIFSAFLYVSLTSNAIGPAHANNGNRTGSPGSAGTCASAGCHTGGSGTVTGEIIVRKKSAGPSSEPVVVYEAGEQYTITVNGTGTDKPGFGFQLVALNESNQSVGSFSGFPAHVGSTQTNGVTVVEHTLPLTATGGNYNISFDWTAPSSGSPKVTFHGIINAVNATGGNDNDVVSAPFQTRLSPTSIPNVTRNIEVRLFPNPARNSIQVVIGNTLPGTHMLVVYDLSGKKMYEASILPDNGRLETTIVTEKWASGVYYLQIFKDGMEFATPFLKN
jgi:hypothetical protein